MNSPPWSDEQVLGESETVIDTIVYVDYWSKFSTLQVLLASLLGPSWSMSLVPCTFLHLFIPVGGSGLEMVLVVK